jgi:hypothetical protein
MYPLARAKVEGAKTSEAFLHMVFYMVMWNLI